MNNIGLRVIGDIHGNRHNYRIAIKDAPYTIQLGDMDHQYSWMVDENIDQTRHKFFPGNHDDYNLAPKSPHNLGDFGVYNVPDFGEIFFVRGAWSIDRNYRKSVWEQEELSISDCYRALEAYKQAKPKFLIAHECPLSIVQFVTNPKFARDMGFNEAVIKTKTNQLLQAMIEEHKPHTMIFGHYHKCFDKVIDGIRFICANICQPVDFPKNYLS